MEIESRTDADESLVLAFKGDLSGPLPADLDARIDALLAAAPGAPVVLDFTAVQDIGVAGVQVLTRAAHRIIEQGRKISIKAEGSGAEALMHLGSMSAIARPTRGGGPWPWLFLLGAAGSAVLLWARIGG